MKTYFFLLIALLALNSSCSKNSNGSSNNTVKFQLQTINRSSVLGRVDAGALQWTSGYGWASEIKFEAKLNGVETKIKSQTVQKLDLFTPVTTLGIITLTPGTYSEVEFKVELNAIGADAALELNGQFTSGGVTTPVVLKVSAPVELKNEKSNVVVTDNSVYKAITTINLSLLTKNITEAMLNSAVKTNGTILITSTINTNLYNILLSNLHDCDEVEFEHD